MAEKQKHYWTFENDGEVCDLECSTEEEAVQFADNIFQQEHYDDGCRGIEEREIDLLRFCYTFEGEQKIIERKNHTLEYSYYHGDFAEHNTNWNLL